MDTQHVGTNHTDEVTERTPLIITRGTNFSYSGQRSDSLISSSSHLSTTTTYSKFSLVDDRNEPNDIKVSVLLPSLWHSHRESTRSLFETFQPQNSLPQVTQSFTKTENFSNKFSSDRGASALLAMWNILPLASSVFSLPYCVAIGGYIVLPLIFVISIMADATGILLVDCMYEQSENNKERRKVHSNYVDIARSAWGKLGAKFMNFVLVFYLYTGCVLNILLIGKSMYDVLQPHTSLSFTALTIIFSASVYPTLFVRKISVLSYLSMAGFTSLFVAVIAIMVAFLVEAGSWSIHMKEIPAINFKGLPLAISIITLTCVVHTVLPKIESSMKDCTKINQVLHQSFAVTAALKFFIASFGCFTYGLFTQSIVTLNVALDNEFAHITCALALLVYAVLNYPMGMFIVSEFVDSLTEKTVIEKKYFYFWMAASRFILVSGTVAIAVFVPHFAIILALRGSLIGTSLVYIFPCYFHLKLKWKNLSVRQRSWDFLLLLTGVLFGVTGFYASVNRLIAIIKN
ncbi:vesicular inhibitory amino acid transporter isoform X2 [Hydra vulgaris]|uniref:Vesicular inhibitory amino acid transporter isoform X2 n=1 Tax=Hydra vulgaris TaxID=6087 RepID=A0ABM4DF94_HYDVU